jgi:hypothetical protein
MEYPLLSFAVCMNDVCMDISFYMSILPVPKHPAISNDMEIIVANIIMNF